MTARLAMARRRVAVVLAVARYLAADVTRSQRVLLPVVTHAAVLAVLFGGDPGPPPAPWAASAIVLCPVAAWLALVVANTEDPAQRHVTVAAAGGPGTVAAGTLVVALAADATLVALSVAWPVVVTRHDHPLDVVVLGAAGHAATALTGTALGVLCARPLVRRIGWSFLLVALAVLAVVTQPTVAPVGTAVAALVDAGPAPVSSVAVAAALAVLATAVVAVADGRGAPRRTRTDGS